MVSLIPQSHPWSPRCQPHIILVRTGEGRQPVWRYHFLLWSYTLIEFVTATDLNHNFSVTECFMWCPVCRTLLSAYVVIHMSSAFSSFMYVIPGILSSSRLDLDFCNESASFCVLHTPKIAWGNLIDAIYVYHLETYKSIWLLSSFFC